MEEEEREEVTNYMQSYFNINYEFDKQAIHHAIDTTQKGYICVADGTIMRYVHQDADYCRIVNEALFSISDSSWAPMFLKWIYGIHVEPYPGPELFMDVIKQKKHRMFFMGGSNDVLHALKAELVKIDNRITDMQFYELPYSKVEDFDYEGIAKVINEDNPDIIWVSLGAPKQERFMNRLNPYLNRGVQIAVGAAFTFYSGLNGTKRAPRWIQKMKLEFLFRVFQEPQKQGRRCFDHVRSLPSILHAEIKRKRQEKN